MRRCSQLTYGRCGHSTNRFTTSTTRPATDQADMSQFDHLSRRTDEVAWCDAELTRRTLMSPRVDMMQLAPRKAMGPY